MDITLQSGATLKIHGGPGAYSGSEPECEYEWPRTDKEIKGCSGVHITKVVRIIKPLQWADAKLEHMDMDSLFGWLCDELNREIRAKCASDVALSVKPYGSEVDGGVFGFLMKVKTDAVDSFEVLSSLHTMKKDRI